MMWWNSDGVNLILWKDMDKICQNEDFLNGKKTKFWWNLGKCFILLKGVHKNLRKYWVSFYKQVQYDEMKSKKNHYDEM